MVLTTLAAAWGALVLAEVLWTFRRLRQVVGPRQTSTEWVGAYPSVSVIRPIRGLDVEAEANIAAALETGYPGPVETLFVFDDESDDAFPLVCRAVRAHREAGRPGRVAVLVAGPPPVGRTGKLNAMMVGMRHAQGELVAFGDSDTRPDRELLRQLVEILLTTPGAGDAFAPVVANAPPRTAGDVGYQLLINAWYGPAVALAAERKGEVPFIMGQLMVFRREALEAIGGLDAADGQLVDDMYLGSLMTRAGYTNIMAPHPLPIATGGLSFIEFARLFRRWLLFSRNGLPLSFTWTMWLRGGEFWTAAAALGLALASGSALAALPPAGALVALLATQAELQRQRGGPPLRLRHGWVACAIPLLAPGIVAESLLRRRVDWRGRPYALDAQARLA